MSFLVTKCICHDRDFKEIRKFTEENNLIRIEELQSRGYCSCGCGLCIPYIERMLETGKTEFEPGAYYKTENIG